MFLLHLCSFCQVNDFSFDIIKATAEKQGKVFELNSAEKKVQGDTTDFKKPEKEKAPKFRGLVLKNGAGNGI